jgi:hypothetical protein
MAFRGRIQVTTEVKKMKLKKLPPNKCQINYYSDISILNLHLSVKLKLFSFSVGWQGWWAGGQYINCKRQHQLSLTVFVKF